MALLTPDATPTLVSPTDDITVDVKGATVTVIPTARMQTPGRTPIQNGLAKSDALSGPSPAAAMTGPIVNENRGPILSDRPPDKDDPKPMINANGIRAAPA